eukprot:TRINITY_DN20175_c0_g1_i4.p2 TRINITY_DN20175_c0_g1~~TRINITY_DN20175_c0_g1_i4.p2  ORF type:complete len:382 (-),score=74.53 TRINITY_DN20175_c0_g1_i4:460-1605(-)
MQGQAEQERRLLMMGIEQRYRHLNDAFRSVDTDKSGFLDSEEVRALCERFGVAGTNMDSIMHSCDLNSDGRISYDEFANTLKRRDWPHLPEIYEGELPQPPGAGRQLLHPKFAAPSPATRQQIADETATQNYTVPAVAAGAPTRYAYADDLQHKRHVPGTQQRSNSGEFIPAKRMVATPAAVQLPPDKELFPTHRRPATAMTAAATHLKADNPILQQNSGAPTPDKPTKRPAQTRRPDQVSAMGSRLEGPEAGLFPGTTSDHPSIRQHPSAHKPTMHRVMPLDVQHRGGGQAGLAASEAIPSTKARMVNHAAHQDNVGALINYKFAGAMHDSDGAALRRHYQSAKAHESHIHEYHEGRSAPAHQLRSDVTKVFLATQQGPR